jgi:ABC-type sugar transport system substrate-binding protein
LGIAACNRSGGSSKSGGSSGSSGSSKSSQLKIAFVPYGFNQEFHRVIADRVKQKVEADGNLYIEADPAGDGSAQIDMVNDVIAQKADLVIISAINPDSIIPALEACKAAGIKVLNYDCAVGDPSLAESFVTSDNYLLGKLAGDYWLDNVATTGKVIIFTNDEVDGPRLRHQGFKDRINERGGGIEFVRVQYNGGDIRQQVEDSLTANPDANGYFGTVSIITTEAYASIDARGIGDKVPIISVDGSPDEKKLLQVDGIVATVAQSTNSIADKCVEFAYKILAGEEVEAQFLVPGFIIDKNNLSQYDINGWQ